MLTQEQADKVLELSKAYADVCAVAQSIWDEFANLTPEEQFALDIAKKSLEEYVNSLVTI